MSDTQVKATPSKAAIRLAQDLSRDHWEIYAPQIQSALSDLLEKAQTLYCRFGGYAPSHGCACNNCDLAKALEPWKPK